MEYICRDPPLQVPNGVSPLQGEGFTHLEDVIAGLRRVLFSGSLVTPYLFYLFANQ
jgi:hypothetical protein